VAPSFQRPFQAANSNVALTAPYFHDGAAPTLSVAVSTMGAYQLGRTLTRAEVDTLVAFLGSLTGETLAANGAISPRAGGAEDHSY